MIQIQKLAQQLQAPTLNERYPALFAPHDGKKHVLYWSMFDNATGLYRGILPAMEMNRSGTHTAMVLEIRKWNPENALKGHAVNFNDTLIRWADYIVFQTSFHDLASDIKQLRAINSNVQFVMDVDDNIHAHPNKHLESTVLARNMREQLLKNMTAVDVVTGTNDRLMAFYDELLNRTYPGSKTEFFTLPNLMSSICYDGITLPAERKEGPIRIGMSFNNTQFTDLNPFRKVLLEINKKYGEEVEIINFGWNGRMPNHADAMRGVKHTHVKPVTIYEYFKTLLDLQFDMALMPLQDTEFNLMKSHHKLLQYSMYKIPTIVSYIKTYTDIIFEDKEAPDAGLIDSIVPTSNAEWIDAVDMLMDEEERRRRGEASKNAVESDFMYPSNMHIWQNCFI